MEIGGKSIHTISLVTRCVFACGEGEEVVLREHIGQTAVVCDHRRSDATAASDLDNIFLLVKEACIVNGEWITPTMNWHQECAPTPKMKNVVVRRKNKTDKPTDLRSEPMLRRKKRSRRQSAMAQSSHL